MSASPRFEHTLFTRTFSLCAALALAAGCTTRIDTVGGPEEQTGGDALSAELGLERSDLVTPQIAQRTDGVTEVSLAIAGQEREITLEPATVRTSTFELFVQTEGGALEKIEPPPSRAVRGTVTGVAGSVVTGAWLDDGLHARVALAKDDVYWIEPVARVSPADAGRYLLYRDEDVIEVPHACGLNDVTHGTITDPLALLAAAGEGVAVAELAVDADFEFFETWGSVDNSIARIESVVAAINTQYESEVGITHLISAAIIRTSADDPYTSTDPATMLQDELRPEWLNNHGDIQRDTVHLFTGKDIDGGTIGIAYVGAICGSFGFGLSQSTFSSNFACVTDLTAHELGHNWAANHCNCTSNTMNPFLTCSNTFHPTETVPTIEGHRDSRSCLDYGDACPEDPDKLDPGQCGCGVPDTDTDLDGTADCIDGCPDDAGKTDPGQCGCGTPDVHSDGDGVADCLDGCPLDGAKTDPGQCGCGVADTDTDGDGVADCIDGCPDDPTATDPAACADPACGDGTCDPGEHPCNCPDDCGAPPASELSCSDGADEDCDGAADCDDADCAADAACVPTCQPNDTACTSDGDCCSGDCAGPRHRRTCRSGGGGGGGSDKCGLPGTPCTGHGNCCSRECAGPAGARTCQEPAAGVIEREIPDSPEESDASPSLQGGCSAGGGSRSWAAWLLLGMMLRPARRRRSRAQGAGGVAVPPLPSRNSLR